MKKLVAVAILVLFAMLVWDIGLNLNDMHVEFDGDEVGGPLGALIGLVAGGAGLLIAGVVLAAVGLFLAMLFAGLGIVAILGLAAGAVVLAALVSPLLLPLALVMLVVWALSGRRKARAKAEAV